MKIYIAGKITGLDEDLAYAKFLMAEAVIEIAEHEPLNPMKLVDQGMFNQDGSCRAYSDFLLDAIRVVLKDAEALYMLSNWRDSLGARNQGNASAVYRMKAQEEFFYSSGIFS